MCRMFVKGRCRAVRGLTVPAPTERSLMLLLVITVIIILLYLSKLELVL